MEHLVPAHMRHDCEQCGGQFLGRADARYCSSACRQRAYRERQIKGPTLFPVRLANNILMLPIGDDGVIDIPSNATIDIELTDTFVAVLRDLGLDEAKVEQAMNQLRVDYVNGRCMRQ